MERIVKKIELSIRDVERVLWACGLSPTGDPEAVGGGRIANNILIKTTQLGDVIVRAYPFAYGDAKIRFEVDTLQHLSERGCDVPRPIRLVRERSGHQAIYTTPDVQIFLYQALPGSTLQQSELSPKVATAAGRALAKILPHAASFTPADLVPQGDLGFIAGLLRAAKERDENLAINPIVAEMEAILSDGTLARALAKCSHGVVHADYFFENILADGERSAVTGILDFGDAYYGSIINDVVIGAMEFAVSVDESWNLDSFDLFVRECRAWLVKERLSADLMRRLLLANCIRFGIYTLPFSNAEGIPTSANRYLKRFKAIRDSGLGRDLEEIWIKNMK